MSPENKAPQASTQWPRLYPVQSTSCSSWILLFLSLTGATQKLDFCSSEIDSQGAPIQHLGANMIIITYQRPQLQSGTDLLHRHLQFHPNTCLNAPRKWTNNCGRKHQRAANLEQFLPSRKAFKYQEVSERVKLDARER